MFLFKKKEPIVPEDTSTRTPDTVLLTVFAQTYLDAFKFKPEIITNFVYYKHLNDLPEITEAEGKSCIIPKELVNVLLQSYEVKNRLRSQTKNDLNMAVSMVGKNSFTKLDKVRAMKAMLPNITEADKDLITILELGEKVFWTCCRILLFNAKISTNLQFGVGIRKKNQHFVCIKLEDEPINANGLPEELLNLLQKAIGK